MCRLIHLKELLAVQAATSCPLTYTHVHAMQGASMRCTCTLSCPVNKDNPVDLHVLSHAANLLQPLLIQYLCDSCLFSQSEDHSYYLHIQPSSCVWCNPVPVSLPVCTIQRSAGSCLILHREGSAWQPCSRKSERLTLCLLMTLHTKQILVICNTGTDQTACKVHCVGPLLLQI